MEVSPAMRLIGRLKRSLQAIPKSVLLGVGGVALSFVASAGIYATALPWIGAADSARHVDYVYRMHNLELAQPHSIAYDINLDDPKSSDQASFTRNGAAPHPPLHYAVMALFAGGLLESGNWQTSVAVIRAINVLIGLLAIVVLAWAGWRLGGRHHQYFAVAVPAFAGLITPFVTVVADVYNDPLVVLMATVALAVTAVCLKTGPSARRLAILAIVCALGMLTKVTFLSTLLLVMFFVTVAYALHCRDKLKVLRLAGVANVSIVLSVVASSGWFYWRNHQLSGSWFRAYPKYEIGGREQQTLLDSLTNPHFWGVIPEGLFGIRSWQDILPINKQLSLVVFLLATAGFLYVAVKVFLRWRSSNSKYSRQQLAMISIVALMCLQIIALYAQQLQHSVGWGLINPRYFLTGLLPIGLFFAIASLAIRRHKQYLVSLAVVSYSLAAMLNAAYYVQTRQGIISDGNVFDKLASMIAANGLASGLLYASLALVAVATAMVFVAIKNIHNQPLTNQLT